MHSTLQVEKIHNGNFADYDTDHNGYIAVDCWGSGSYGGYQYVTVDTDDTVSGSNAVQFFSAGHLSPALIYPSHPISVDNSVTYSISFYYYLTGYGYSTHAVKLRQYNADCDIIQTDTVKQFTSPDVLHTWVKITKTIGPTGSGADIIFDSDAQLIDIIVSYDGINTLRIAQVKMLGESFTFTHNDFDDTDISYDIPQTVAETAGGNINASELYNEASKTYTLQFSDILRSEYNTLYSFLMSNDVRVGVGRLYYTDSKGIITLGRLSADFNANEDQRAGYISGTIEFKEL